MGVWSLKKNLSKKHKDMNWFPIPDVHDQHISSHPNPFLRKSSIFAYHRPHANFELLGGHQLHGLVLLPAPGGKDRWCKSLIDQWFEAISTRACMNFGCIKHILPHAAHRLRKDDDIHISKQPKYQPWHSCEELPPPCGSRAHWPWWFSPHKYLGHQMLVQRKGNTR